MAPRRESQDPLFPARTDYPQTKKMVDSFEGNMAIYEFMEHLVRGGYVLARHDPDTGALRAMRTDSTVQHEVLVFRGVDKVAYQLEHDAMRLAYPHIWGQYGGRDGEQIVVGPEFAEPVRPAKPVAREVAADLPDGMEVSLAQAFRLGIFRSASYTAARMKMMRCRRLYPEIMPKMRPRGSETLYLVGDLKRWEDDYDRRASLNIQRARKDQAAHMNLKRWGGESAEQAQPPVPATPPAPLDALAFLMSKIRGEKEDVQKED